VHGLNTLPLKYPLNREFAAALWPDKDLMTYRNGGRARARLVTKAPRIDTLKYGRTDDEKEAKGVVEDIRLAPLLKNAHCVGRSRVGSHQASPCLCASTARKSATMMQRW
jgi:hypothetical protein